MIRKIWTKMELIESWRGGPFMFAWGISWAVSATWFGINVVPTGSTDLSLLCVGIVIVLVTGFISFMMATMVWGIGNLWINWKEYPPTYTAYDEEGKKHYFDTPEEARAFAREHPIWLTPRKKDE